MRRAAPAMMLELEFDVTQRDIDMAVPMCDTLCAIAVALLRGMEQKFSKKRKVEGVQVFPNMISIAVRPPPKLDEYKTDDALTHWIINYDFYRELCKPITVVLKDGVAYIKREADNVNA